MKKLLIALLLFSTPCFATMPRTMSVMGGLGAINGEVGYTLGVFSPYASNDMSLLLQYSQYLTQASNSYSMVTFGGISRVINIFDFDVYWKSAVFVVLFDQTNIGLNFAGGTEYKTKYWDRVSFFMEFGYSFPMVYHTYAQGVALNLGLKLYL